MGSLALHFSHKPERGCKPISNVCTLLGTPEGICDCLLCAGIWAEQQTQQKLFSCFFFSIITELKNKEGN